MKKLFITFLFLLMGGLALAQAPHLFEHTYPIVAEENAVIRNLMEQVSADSLRATIEHLSSYHTRRYDSQMVYDVQDWLYNRYAELHFDSIYLHDFQFIHNDIPVETSDNVIVIQKGTKFPDEYVVCGAHYDSFNNDGADPDTIFAPGADDNATGVAGILETARILRQCSFDRSIIYCAWAAEEVGLKGSAAYAQDCAEKMVDIVGYFNLDMTGYLEAGSDMLVHLLYTEQDSVFADYVFSFSHTYFPGMHISHNWLMNGADSDFSSFNRNGYPAVHPSENVHHLSPYIHSRQDMLGVSVNNMDQVKRFTELNLGTVATLAGWNGWTGIEENLQSHVTVYPNPTRQKVNICSMDEIHTIRIYNVLGQIMEKIITNGQCAYVLDLSRYHSGLYLINVTTAHNNMTQQLVVQ